jgi:hypothetical protein
MRWIIVIMAALCLTCQNKQTSTVEAQDITTSFKQQPGCIGSGADQLFKMSCFDYSFQTNLNVDFCLPGNCCPDSNRYALTINVIDDTIQCAVVDTAANLCRCMCNYVLHTEITGLAKDKYVFHCQMADSVYYSEIVKR